MPQPHRVCRVEELPPGQRRIMDVEGRSIGVFNVDGAYHAIRNLCPHEGAPLCRGPLTGTTAPSKPGEYQWIKDGCIVRCPWHGWEFDVTTGQSVFNPHRLRVKAYEVAVEAPGPVSAPAADCDAAREDDPTLETFTVRVEDRWIVVYV